MKKNILTILAMCGVVAGFAANFATAAEEEKKAKKKADPAARFAKLDKDSDGKITAEELKAGFKKKPEMAEKILKAKDKNKDGNLSKEEFVAKRTPKKKGDAAKKPAKKPAKKKDAE
ncbi:MAG: EF-hand domain-containing protein [Verrucomicrobiaceae bacterium]|nr:EF-hand domain-containing protein [Verrucomicrobiaceae bacterium]